MENKTITRKIINQEVKQKNIQKDSNDMQMRSEPETTRTEYGRDVHRPLGLKYYDNHIYN